MTGPQQSGKADEADEVDGEDRSSVLLDDRSEDTSSTATADSDDTESARDTETAVEDVDADDGVEDTDTDTAVAADDDRSDDERSTAAAVDADDDDRDDDRDDDDLHDQERAGASRTGFFAALGVAVVAVLGVLFLLGAFVWPAFLGPGAPEDPANGAIGALSSKDSAKVAEVSCKRSDGSSAAQFPPELMQLIGQVAPAGPVQRTLDSEARAPIDLTLTQGGQSQALPADLLFAVNDGDWCLNGIAQRQ